MYTNAGYLIPDEMELSDCSVPLRVNSCGDYRLLTRPSMHTSRPLGREDYQLLYIASGKAFFQYKEQLLTVPAGHMFLYAPGEIQSYHYYLENSPIVLWVHFTGSEAKALAAACGFDKAPVLACGLLPEYEELFSKMIRELQVAKPQFELMTSLYLRQLFALLMRSLAEDIPGKHKVPREIEEAVHYFHENFTKDIEIEDYAKSRHMSCCWFIRCFKQQMGVPPLKYLTQIRINRARELLTGTDYTISEISEIAGYNNPLYFSKLFKKQTGVSPKAYREHNLRD